MTERNKGWMNKVAVPLHGRSGHEGRPGDDSEL